MSSVVMSPHFILINLKFLGNKSECDDENKTACTYLVQIVNATAQKVRCSIFGVIDNHASLSRVPTAGGDPNPVITK